MTHWSFEKTTLILTEHQLYGAIHAVDHATVLNSENTTKYVFGAHSIAARSANVTEKQLNCIAHECARR
jgi:hypothetical protein